MAKLSHINSAGQAHMVDVSEKADTNREAQAQAIVTMTTETLALVTSGSANKGDVLATTRLAGIMATKQTSNLIPLCHPLPVAKATIDLTTDTALPGIKIVCTVKTTGKTGVEMEALTGASVAALTLYDMLKAAEKGIVISDIKLLAKTGGKSGDWTSPA